MLQSLAQRRLWIIGIPLVLTLVIVVARVAFDANRPFNIFLTAQVSSPPGCEGVALTYQKMVDRRPAPGWTWYWGDGINAPQDGVTGADGTDFAFAAGDPSVGCSFSVYETLDQNLKEDYFAESLAWYTNMGRGSGWQLDMRRAAMLPNWAGNSVRFSMIMREAGFLPTACLVSQGDTTRPTRGFASWVSGGINGDPEADINAWSQIQQSQISPIKQATCTMYNTTVCQDLVADTIYDDAVMDGRDTFTHANGGHETVTGSFMRIYSYPRGYGEYISADTDLNETLNMRWNASGPETWKYPFFATAETFHWTSLTQRGFSIPGIVGETLFAIGDRSFRAYAMPLGLHIAEQGIGGQNTESQLQFMPWLYQPGKYNLVDYQYFEAEDRQFILISEYDPQNEDDQNLTIYEWNGTIFEEFKRIDTIFGSQPRMLRTGSGWFLANTGPGLPLKFYKYEPATVDFTLYQEEPDISSGALLSYFTGEDIHLGVFGEDYDFTTGLSPTYEFYWNGAEFTIYYEAPPDPENWRFPPAERASVRIGTGFTLTATRKGRVTQALQIMSSKVLTSIQTINAPGNFGFDMFEYNKEGYLVTTSPQGNTTLYKYGNEVPVLHEHASVRSGLFAIVQTLPTAGASVSAFVLNQIPYLAVATNSELQFYRWSSPLNQFVSAGQQSISSASVPRINGFEHDGKAYITYTDQAATTATTSLFLDNGTSFQAAGSLTGKALEALTVSGTAYILMSNGKMHVWADGASVAVIHNKSFAPATDWSSFVHDGKQFIVQAVGHELRFFRIGQCADGNSCRAHGACTACIAGEDCSATSGGEGVCGNTILETGEECDDGNTVSADGCTAQCVKEYCGDSTTQPIPVDITPGVPFTSNTSHPNTNPGGSTTVGQFGALPAKTSPQEPKSLWSNFWGLLAAESGSSSSNPFIFDSVSSGGNEVCSAELQEACEWGLTHYPACECKPPPCECNEADADNCTPSAEGEFACNDCRYEPAGPLDIAIVIDSTTSVSDAEWSAFMSLLKRVVSAYEMGAGENQVRYVAFEFGREGLYNALAPATAGTGMPPGTFSTDAADVANLNLQSREIAEPQFDALGPALLTAQAYLEANGREGARRVIWALHDISCCGWPGDQPEMARQVRDAGTTIIGIRTLGATADTSQVPSPGFDFDLQDDLNEILRKFEQDVKPLICVKDDDLIEQCDDGNHADGDGCSAICQLENPTSSSSSSQGGTNTSSSSSSTVSSSSSSSSLHGAGSSSLRSDSGDGRYYPCSSYTQEGPAAWQGSVLRSVVLAGQSCGSNFPS